MQIANVLALIAEVPLLPLFKVYGCQPWIIITLFAALGSGNVRVGVDPPFAMYVVPSTRFKLPVNTTGSGAAPNEATAPAAVVAPVPPLLTANVADNPAAVPLVF